MNRKMLNVALGVIVLSTFVGIAWIPTSAFAVGHSQSRIANIAQTNSPLRTAAVPSVIQTHARHRADESPHDTWTPIAQLPIAIVDATAACDPATGKVYVENGYSNGSFVTDGYVYDPAANAWAQIADSPVARDAPAGALINGKFYVVNGWGTNYGPVTALDIYDLASDSWSTGADNPLPTSGASVGVALNGKLYVVGGCLSSAQCNPSSALQIYDPASDSWTSGADYPQPVTWEMCGAIQGKLYCAGGYGPNSAYSTGYVYDPATDTWSPIAAMLYAAWGAAYGVLDNNLVIVNGVTNGGTTVTNQVQIYDPASDSWSAGPNSIYTFYRAGSASCDGGLYIIGGMGQGFGGGWRPVPTVIVYP